MPFMFYLRRSRVPILRRKPLSRVSAKRLTESAEYNRLKPLFLAEHPWCSLETCGKGSVDVHHTRGRAGRLFLDVRFWKALCRQHHNQVLANPEWARANGLLPEKGQWNQPLPTERIL